MKPWGEFFARFKAPRAWNTKVLDEVRPNPYYSSYTINTTTVVLVLEMMLASMFCTLVLGPQSLPFGPAVLQYTGTRYPTLTVA